MVEYKYVVTANNPTFQTKTFDTIEEALAYAKEGISSFIYEYAATENGIDEDTEELVWNWDDIWDDDETVISRIKSRHSDVAEDFKIEIEKTPEEVDIRTSGDEAQELMDFARAILGDNFDVFDCDFAECETCEYPEDTEVAPADFDYEVDEPVADDVADIDPFEGSFVTRNDSVEEEPADEIPEEAKQLVAEIENTPADESPKDMINGKLVDAKDPLNSEVDELLTEAKKEEDELPPDPNAVKVEVHGMLNDLVADEIEAINGYEAVKAELIDKPIAHKDEIVNTLDHIKDEETEHIDELINAAAEIPFEDDPGEVVEPLEEPVAEVESSEPMEEDLGFVPFDSDVRVGNKIRIIHLEGEDTRYDGKEGTVETVDGIGQLHGTWGGLAVIPGVDNFEVIPNTKGNVKEALENSSKLSEGSLASKAIAKIKDSNSRSAAIAALRAGKLDVAKQFIGDSIEGLDEGTTAEFVNEDYQYKVVDEADPETAITMGTSAECYAWVEDHAADGKKYKVTNCQECLKEDAYDGLDDFLVGPQSDELDSTQYELEQEYKDSLKTYNCFFDGEFLGTVRAANEEDAYYEMENTWPEYPYGLYDGVAEVEETDEVDESLESDDISDEEFIEAFGREIASKYKSVNE